MFIKGLGTATPEWRYTQDECYRALETSPLFPALGCRSQALLRKVLRGRNGIETRHLALASLEEAFQVDPDTLHARFVAHAPQLASRAARRALENAGVPAADIDGLVISTCTGYLCPGLTSYVIELLGLAPDVLALDLVGQGCGAAIPNLRTAVALLAGGQCRHVLSICVEVCSAAFYLDSDPGVLISACLFGDGAGAAVLGTEAGNSGHPSLRWRVSASHTETADRDLLRFEQRQGLLRNILKPEVPDRAGLHARRVFEKVAGAGEVATGDIRRWIFHPGGRDVLISLRQTFGLTEEQVAASARVLQRYGNLSSASLYFVLQEALSNAPVGGPWWLSSFGAGFSCHGALLDVNI
jgi:alkylresorcinol/alkylpyrone synthase